MRQLMEIAGDARRVRHMEEWNASLPPRRMQAEPALKQSAAASTVTLGRAS